MQTPVLPPDLVRHRDASISPGVASVRVTSEFVHSPLVYGRVSARKRRYVFSCLMRTAALTMADRNTVHGAVRLADDYCVKAEPNLSFARFGIVALAALRIFEKLDEDVFYSPLEVLAHQYRTIFDGYNDVPVTRIKEAIDACEVKLLTFVKYELRKFRAETVYDVAFEEVQRRREAGEVVNLRTVGRACDAAVLDHRTLGGNVRDLAHSLVSRIAAFPNLREPTEKEEDEAIPTATTMKYLKEIRGIDEYVQTYNSWYTAASEDEVGTATSATPEPAVAEPVTPEPTSESGGERKRMRLA